MEASRKYYIPTPPSVNSLFCNNFGKGRGRFKSGKYVSWIADATRSILDTNPNPFKVEKFGIDLYVSRPNKQSDLDNRIKAIPDLLKICGIIDDDKNLDKISVTWLNKTDRTYFILYDIKELSGQNEKVNY